MGPHTVMPDISQNCNGSKKCEGKQKEEGEGTVIIPKS